MVYKNKIGILGMRPGVLGMRTGVLGMRPGVLGMRLTILLKLVLLVENKECIVCNHSLPYQMILKHPYTEEFTVICYDILVL